MGCLHTFLKCRRNNIMFYLSTWDCILLSSNMTSTSALPPNGGQDCGDDPDKRKGKKISKPRECMGGKSKTQWSGEKKKEIIKMIED